ncbi:MAG: hypothetical protein JWM58_2187 [Rhizobium sp.]|nr:hypothetical protein [Rhizobium sp.]
MDAGTHFGISAGQALYSGTVNAYSILLKYTTIQMLAGREIMIVRAPVLFAVLAFGAVLAPTTNALAWGCVAEATDGASGWSNNYDTESDANARALRECHAKTSDTCKITDCNQDW